MRLFIAIDKKTFPKHFDIGPVLGYVRIYVLDQRTILASQKTLTNGIKKKIRLINKFVTGLFRSPMPG
jgi:hypothetical protein